MEYTVKSGDSLSLIARANGTTVSTLMRLNPEIENANQIYPQQRIRLPDAAAGRQTRQVGQVADCSECADEYVDLLHQAEAGIFIPLTAAHQREIEQEEAVLHQFMSQFHGVMEDTEANILAFKDAFIERLQQERIIDPNKPSEPMQLTEIRRLKGNNHYAYVRKDSGWRRHRSYSIDAQDRARAKGWYDSGNRTINGQKLVEAIATDMNKPSLRLTLHQSFVDWCLMEWQSDPARWTPVEGMEPIVVGAQAQAMRYAMGASLQSGYDPRQLSVHIAAKASASASLAEGKAYATTTWPAEDESEWLIYYRDQNNQRQAASLGKFRAKVSAELVGFAGVSAMLSAEVHVAMNNGIPQLRGVGDSNRTSRNGEPASIEAGAFAGVRADGKLEGSIEWQDTLVDVPQWKALSTLGVGAGAALGLGGEARVKLKWSPTTQKFYFNAHAGLVIGAGASGEVGAEVNAGEFPSMLRCIYNGLLTIDFRRLEDIEAEAFQLLCNLALRGLIFGISITNTAFELGSQSAEIIKGQVDEILNRVAASRERERIALQTARNIIEDTNLGAESWVLYSPPEVKGALLDLICYDHILTPGDRLPLVADSRADAIMIILQSSQCWRDYEEMVSRMNSGGTKGDYQTNRGRLIRLMRILPTIRLFQLERSLQQTCAIPNRPLTFAPHIRLTETRYA